VWLPAPCEWLAPPEPPLSLLLSDDLLSDDLLSDDLLSDDDEELDESESVEPSLFDELPFAGNLLPEPDP
jgi:hypothetical protein